jgi:hypothetical protein
VKASLGKKASRKPLRRQWEQLQLIALSGSGASTENATFPQWQLPSNAMVAVLRLAEAGLKIRKPIAQLRGCGRPAGGGVAPA